MKVIVTRVPKAILDEIDILVKMGRYTSRAEVIRVAVRDLIRKEFVSARNDLKVLG
ncbi:MAG: ribbon-helix-helix domain-containing protein [archaeon GB-1867-097]|nr:ribbon-helix-helix protein, CopG family [Candidatus Verstraetearchaeota archaeon]MCS7374115.1 ribbon-helix-helix domain-containing protein [Candidatus Culexmicrobium thermophilum]MCS7385037.1 ribbon-helix-helix domain-containing protein [Candidatus Culexmicrobium thermophilum]RLE56179.1 MAG: CopG family transcriptional regulator [Candidatus Verstraetearchaeota archaeon]HDO19944.1 ribbon-helix-helix protein, CopG family [Candidatus Bathyarchaeota archaeon]